MSTGKQYDADEIGVNLIKQFPTQEIKTGDVGYIISGIKEAKEVKVGETLLLLLKIRRKVGLKGLKKLNPWFCWNLSSRDRRV